MEKRCTKCGGAGPFHRRKEGKDGLNSQCARCVTDKVKAWQAKNREQVRAAKRRPDAMARHRTINRNWMRSNKAKAKEWFRSFRERNTERLRHACREWRARVKAADCGDVTVDGWLDILEYFDHRCAYCLRKCDDLEQDHVIALNRDGEHTIGNLVPACPSCNARKRDRPVWYMLSG